MFLYSIETWEQQVDREFSWNLSLELSQAETEQKTEQRVHLIIRLRTEPGTYLLKK